MFERLVMGRAAETVARRVADGTDFFKPFSIGDLAEALVFYDRVYLLGFANDLAKLAHSIGGETFYRLCAAGYLRVRFYQRRFFAGVDREEPIPDDAEKARRQKSIRRTFSALAWQHPKIGAGPGKHVGLIHHDP